jgi:hypothetical protein
MQQLAQERLRQQNRLPSTRRRARPAKPRVRTQDNPYAQHAPDDRSSRASQACRNARQHRPAAHDARRTAISSAMNAILKRSSAPSPRGPSPS